MSSSPSPFSPVPPHASTDVNDLLQWAIQNCAHRVSESDELRAEALVLAGSTARGEASVLETEDGFVALSDMEFLIAVGNDGATKRRMAAARALEQQVAEDAAARGLQCSFEFTPTALSYFRAARPCIFVTELARHGKVVWGDPALLETLPDASIPKIDALYLTCNRMVEQLAWRAKICADDGDEGSRAFAYSLVKTYIDLGTSLLIFAGQYESTYTERAKRLASLRDSVAEEIADFDLLLDKIAANSERKLRPTRELLDPMPKEEALRRWAELARFVLRVWRWEVRQLVGVTRGDETAEVLRFAQHCSPWERFRDWAKLARNAAVHGRVSDLLRATYFRGSPRNRLYVEAIIGYAKLAGLESEFALARSSSKSFLPIRSLGKLSTEESVAEAIRIWDVYFRNT